jgi:hypothetical protein
VRPSARLAASFAAVLLVWSPYGPSGRADGFVDPFWITVAVAAGDVDGDGLADLALAQAYIDGPPPHRGRVVFRPQEPGAALRFGRGREFDVGADPGCVIVADLDGDGHTDVVTGDDGSVSVALVRPAEPIVAVRRPVNGRVHQAVAGDIDGDGLVDVVAVTYRGTYVILQTPDHTFGPATRIGPGSYTVALGDFDGDGRADFATVRDRGARGSVLVRFADAASPGAFLPRVEVRLTGRGGQLAAADLDGDGRTDLAIAERFGSGTGPAVLLTAGATSGPFLRERRVGRLPGARQIRATDLTGDGAPDLVYLGTNRLTVFRQVAGRPGEFEATPTRSAGVGPSDLAIAELDDDGFPDVAVLTGAFVHDGGGDHTTDTTFVSGVFVARQDASAPGRLRKIVPITRTD